MKTAFSGLHSTVQRLYKVTFDNNVGQELTLKIGNYTFVDCPQLGASYSADEMASQRYSKFLRHFSGQYKLLIAQSHTVLKEEDSIPITVSLDGLTLSPTQIQVINNSYETTQLTQPWHINLHLQTSVDDTKNETGYDAILTQEYAASLTMHRVDSPQGRNYVVWRYGYGLHEEPLEPAEHISTHLMNRYWDKVANRSPPYEPAF